ncbi:MAG TPA: ABC transporter ATP-binding protein [Candidatus Eremiobacteraeota bacterium]|nr:MAG: putative ABC transporter ATP-binding protein YbhF [bacterium ADurb.Bin363]HPZ07548.1 ABC transporter ATP-binding protein [Candidatus Eremiobacteraeota bacterium]
MIEIKNLTKMYNGFRAVNDMSLSLQPGDAFGFIGPNGAGKTTTIKILATLLEPTEGDAFICGYSVRNNSRKIREVMGYMPDFFGIYDQVKTWEYLNFFASAYKVPGHRRKAVITDVLELTDLYNKRNDYVDNLSRGMKQRLCLARVLIHDPQVLLLDEPASGLDPRARIEMRALLKELRTMGKTVFVSSHILTELSDFVNKIGIIEAGQLLAFGEVDMILKQLTVTRIFKINILNAYDRAKELLEKVSHINRVEVKENIIQFEFRGTDEELAELIKTLVIEGIKVVGLQEQKADLESVFMKITQGVVS